jgi:hypothetical protein
MRARSSALEASPHVGLHLMSEALLRLRFPLRPFTCCDCRKFSRGEVADLMDVLHRAESEVELQMGDPLREWVWWASAVSAAIETACNAAT